MLLRATRLFGKTLFGFYRYLISPALHLFIGGSAGCRFEPTCSRYAQEALARRGLVTGGYLALRRILRCHPFSGKQGDDPVPEH